MHTVLIGGAAGDGVETASAILEKLLKKSGSHLFSLRDAMSRVRGGHNFVQIRFGSTPVGAHRRELNCILAMNEETYSLHKDRLAANGVVICDESLAADDPRILRFPLVSTAKRLGNPRLLGTMAVGALLKIFSRTLDGAREVLEGSLKQKLVDANFAALGEGFSLASPVFPAQPAALADHMLIDGNTATALGALAAGCAFYAAYPMSPATAIMEYLAANSEAMDIAVEQAEDEIAAITMALGASFTGARAMTGSSGGGFSLMVESLGFAGIAELPVVIVNAQRPGPATGLATRTEQADLKFAISASQGEFPRMVIAMRNQTDAFQQTIRAFEIAEAYQIPVILLSDQFLAESSATVPPLSPDAPGLSVKLPPPSEALDGEGEYKRYRFTESGVSPRLIPGRSKRLVRSGSHEHDEYGKITESAELRRKMTDKRLGKLRLLEAELHEPDFFGNEACTTLLVGFGSTHGALKESVALLNANGGNYGALVFGDVWPLPTKLLKHHAARAREIINVEQNATGQLASLIREAACISCSRSILKYDGRQISVDEILDAAKPVTGGGAS